MIKHVPKDHFNEASDSVTGQEMMTYQWPSWKALPRLRLRRSTVISQAKGRETVGITYNTVEENRQTFVDYLWARWLSVQITRSVGGADVRRSPEGVPAQCQI